MPKQPPAGGGASGAATSKSIECRLCHTKFSTWDDCVAHIESEHLAQWSSGRTSPNKSKPDETAKAAPTSRPSVTAAVRQEPARSSSDDQGMGARIPSPTHQPAPDPADLEPAPLSAAVPAYEPYSTSANPPNAAIPSGLDTNYPLDNRTSASQGDDQNFPHQRPSRRPDASDTRLADQYMNANRTKPRSSSDRTGRRRSPARKSEPPRGAADPRDSWSRGAADEDNGQNVDNTNYGAPDGDDSYGAAVDAPWREQDRDDHDESASQEYFAYEEHPSEQLVGSQPVGSERAIQEQLVALRTQLRMQELGEAKAGSEAADPENLQSGREHPEEAQEQKLRAADDDMAREQQRYQASDRAASPAASPKLQPVAPRKRRTSYQDDKPPTRTRNRSRSKERKKGDTGRKRTKPAREAGLSREAPMSNNTSKFDKRLFELEATLRAHEESVSYFREEMHKALQAQQPVDPRMNVVLDEGDLISIGRQCWKQVQERPAAKLKGKHLLTLKQRIGFSKHDKLVSGVFLEYVIVNRQRSLDYCEALLTRLYKEVQYMITSELDDSSEIGSIVRKWNDVQRRYRDQGKGPAKERVLQRHTQFIWLRDQDQFFRNKAMAGKILRLNEENKRLSKGNSKLQAKMKSLEDVLRDLEASMDRLQRDVKAKPRTTEPPARSPRQPAIPPTRVKSPPVQRSTHATSPRHDGPRHSRSRSPYHTPSPDDYYAGGHGGWPQRPDRRQNDYMNGYYPDRHTGEPPRGRTRGMDRFDRVTSPPPRIADGPATTLSLARPDRMTTLPASALSWSADHIYEWLIRISLPEYAQRFLDNHIDGNTLLYTLTDVRTLVNELVMTRIHASKLMREVDNLRLALPVSSWKITDVVNWLSRISMDMYSEMFKRRSITGRILVGQRMTRQLLQHTLGVQDIHISTVQDEIQKLKEQISCTLKLRSREKVRLRLLKHTTIRNVKLHVCAMTGRDRNTCNLLINNKVYSDDETLAIVNTRHSTEIVLQLRETAAERRAHVRGTNEHKLRESQGKVEQMSSEMKIEQGHLQDLQAKLQENSELQRRVEATVIQLTAQLTEAVGQNDQVQINDSYQRLQDAKARLQAIKDDHVALKDQTVSTDTRVRGLDTAVKEEAARINQLRSQASYGDLRSRSRSRTRYDEEPADIEGEYHSYDPVTIDPAVVRRAAEDFAEMYSYTSEWVTEAQQAFEQSNSTKSEKLTDIEQGQRKVQFTVQKIDNDIMDNLSKCQDCVALLTDGKHNEARDSSRKLASLRERTEQLKKQCDLRSAELRVYYDQVQTEMRNREVNEREMMTNRIDDMMKSFNEKHAYVEDHMPERNMTITFDDLESKHTMKRAYENVNTELADLNQLQRLISEMEQITDELLNTEFATDSKHSLAEAEQLVPKAKAQKDEVDKLLRKCVSNKALLESELTNLNQKGVPKEEKVEIDPDFEGSKFVDGELKGYVYHDGFRRWAVATWTTEASGRKMWLYEDDCEELPACEDWEYGELRVEIMQKQKIRVKLDPDQPQKTTPVSMFGFRIGNKPPNTLQTHKQGHQHKTHKKGEQLSFHLDMKEDRLTWATFLRTGRKRATLKREEGQHKYRELKRSDERFHHGHAVDGQLQRRPHSFHNQKSIENHRSHSRKKKPGKSGSTR